MARVSERTAEMGKSEKFRQFFSHAFLTLNMCVFVGITANNASTQHHSFQAIKEQNYDILLYAMNSLALFVYSKSEDTLKSVSVAGRPSVRPAVYTITPEKLIRLS